MSYDHGYDVGDEAIQTVRHSRRRRRRRHDNETRSYKLRDETKRDERSQRKNKRPKQEG